MALFSLFSDERSSQTVPWGDEVRQEGLVGFEVRGRVLFSSRIPRYFVDKVSAEGTSEHVIAVKRVPLALSIARALCNGGTFLACAFCGGLA